MSFNWRLLLAPERHSPRLALLCGVPVLVPAFVVMLVQPEPRLGTVVLVLTANDRSSWKFADEEGVQLVVPSHAPPCAMAAQTGDIQLSDRNRMSHFISRCTPR